MTEFLTSVWTYQFFLLKRIVSCKNENFSEMRQSNAHIINYVGSSSQSILCYAHFTVESYQLKLKKVRAELANLSHCAVPFLSRAAVNLSWYDSTFLHY